jgi:AraC-like DNA-binding protein
VRVADDVPDFHEAPVAACILGPSFIHFCASPALWGLVLFGRPSRDDVVLLAASLELEMARSSEPHVFYVDARLLEGVDPEAFTEVVRVYQRHHDHAASVYSALELVVPDGVEGAVITGFYGNKPPPFPVQARREPSAQVIPAAIERTLAEMVASRRGVSPLIASLRQALLATLVDGDAAAIARRLGMSARTLQRRLQELGTSLQTELAWCRIEQAKRRLAESDSPVTTIALDLGFATPQHFARQFREATGVSPSEWRSGRRGT